MSGFPNSQNDPAAAIPVQLVFGGAFYQASGGGGGGLGTTPLGYQQITSLAAAASLTIPSSATGALIEAETVDVRWRDDGTAPTASIGMLLPAGSARTFIGDLAALQFIQTQASSILNISYYK